jgi:hypothetical protein
VADGDRWQVVLGGVTGITGLGLLTFAASRGLSDDVAHGALGLALVFLIVGTALLALGGFLGHLLQDPPGSQDQ